MRTLVLLTVAALGLSACGGNKTEAKLKSSCETLVKLSGETDVPKNGCSCLSKELVKTLDAKDADILANALGSVKTEEDMMMALMPLMANPKILEGMESAAESCDLDM